MKKNTNHNDGQSWEMPFSQEEQDALKTFEWSDTADSATLPGLIHDSATANAALIKDYERIVNTSFLEDLKKYVPILLLILISTFILDSWHSSTLYQNDPNISSRNSLLYGMHNKNNEILTEHNTKINEPIIPIETLSKKAPPGLIEKSTIKSYSAETKNPVTHLEQPINTDQIKSNSNDLTTIDLNTINNHILKTSALKTIRQAIAADADCSGAISETDIAILRKLILGIYDELPTDKKWVYINKKDADLKYTDQFAAHRYGTSLNNIITPNKSLIQIKVGDVIRENSNLINITNKNKDSLYVFLILTDIVNSDKSSNNYYSIKTNQVFNVLFKGLAKTQGYQFTLNHPGLELIDISPGQNMGLDNFGVFAKEQAVTTSWNGDILPEFSIRFRAKQTGELSDLLSVSSRITKAIAYTYSDAQSMDVALRFEQPKADTEHHNSFELYQNTPNPFTNKTSIGFNLPEAGKVTLSISDKMGRVCFTTEALFPKGENTFVVDRASLPMTSTDVLFYTVKTATNSATKKMDMEIK